jgi:hypothetical protein
VRDTSCAVCAMRVYRAKVDPSGIARAVTAALYRSPK